MVAIRGHYIRLHGIKVLGQDQFTTVFHISPNVKMVYLLGS